MSPASNWQRAAFRCDANEQIGGGHVMRCLTLANALSEAGAEVTFVAAAMPETLAERIASAGHRLEFIPASLELQRESAEWEEPPLSAEAQLADAKATGGAVGHADWVVIDHYLLDALWHSAARDFADQILVIDDLANRSYDCDILLDQTFGRSAQDYHDLVPRGAKVLAGATYALLRPEFARERPAALERRKAGGPVRRILVSMGTMDADGITARIVEQVLLVAPECTIDVVLGPQAASLGQMQEIAACHSRVSIHVNTERMAELMRDADLAIGAAGTTSWERCCLGLPSVVLVLAENQRHGASILSAVGAALAAESVGAVPPAVNELLADSGLLARMSAACFAITDGLGTSRVLEKMLGSGGNRADHLELRKARKTDIEPLWLWRNDPLMRSMAKTTDAIAWREHERWFRQVLDSRDTVLYIAEVSGERAAMVRFDREEGRALVSINVAPHMRGRGIGSTALASACEDFEADNPGASMWAEVRHANTASKLIFRAAGFEEAASDSPEFADLVRRAGQKAGTNENASS